MLDYPSTCKSPQQMFGAIAKTYLADKLGIEAENLVLVSVMPCVAKNMKLIVRNLRTMALKMWI